MVEFGDVFDEVDEFQKKAKVTIHHTPQRPRTLNQPSCRISEARYSGKVANVVFV